MTAKEYEIEVWTKALAGAKDNLLKLCPVLDGGRTDGETEEAYCLRGRALQDEAIRRMRQCETKLANLAA